MRHTPEGNDRSESEMSSGNNTTALEFSVSRAACKKVRKYLFYIQRAKLRRLQCQRVFHRSVQVYRAESLEPCSCVVPLFLRFTAEFV